MCTKELSYNPLSASSWFVRLSPVSHWLCTRGGQRTVLRSGFSFSTFLRPGFPCLPGQLDLELPGESSICFSSWGRRTRIADLNCQIWIFFFFNLGVLRAYMSVCHLQRPEEGIWWGPGMELELQMVGSCHLVRKMNPSSLQEQSALLTTEAPLQPLPFFSSQGFLGSNSGC